jgi:hypothetical protein
VWGKGLEKDRRCASMTRTKFKTHFLPPSLSPSLSPPPTILTALSYFFLLLICSLSEVFSSQVLTGASPNRNVHDSLDVASGVPAPRAAAACLQRHLALMELWPWQPPLVNNRAWNEVPFVHVNSKKTLRSSLVWRSVVRFHKDQYSLHELRLDNSPPSCAFRKHTN